MSTETTYGVSEHGDPTVTFTVTGSHDIFRLAYAMSTFQCDFAERGMAMFRFLSKVTRGFDGLDGSMTGGQVRQRALTAPENAGVVAEAVVASRRWVCADCGDGIEKGSLYVLYTMMPGCEFNDGRKPYRVRYCLSCSDSTESRIALGVHAVKSFRRAEELAS